MTKYDNIVKKVPGNGLCINVCVSSNYISIHPDSRYNEKLDRGTKYRYQATTNFYKFAPEEYKWFWREYMKSEDFKYHGDRMREALAYALKIYRHAYGEIFC